MPIPEPQLETWSHQGAILQSAATYATVRNALQAADSPFANKKPVVFLQGSYCNDTNIYSESDVDVVIRLDTCFQHDLSALPQTEKDAFSAAHSNADYTHFHFKKDVLSHLQATFGAAAKPGDKAVKIEASGSRRDTDVIVAVQFRRYHKFRALNDQTYDTGICFYNNANVRIANYPKQHSENCTAKHQATNSRFKSLVRILKNVRKKLVFDGDLPDGVAPSYFIEGLLYNVPNDRFGGSLEDAFVNCINWIRNADRSSFVCANEQYYLLKGDLNVTWTSDKCDQFLTSVASLWKNW